MKTLWCEVLDAALNDSVVLDIVAAAETGDGIDWLDEYVTDRLGRPEPGYQARALTVAGFRRRNSQSETLLAAEGRSGFLAAVAEKASRRYGRAGWARHWLDAMGEASDLTEFWRYAQLAIGCADLRALLDDGLFDRVPPHLQPYMGGMFEQLVKAADADRKALEDTLFGMKAPRRDLALFLADTLDTSSHAISGDIGATAPKALQHSEVP